ncbi:mediator of RNA polymerase II transcription subunit 4-like [Saccoglossus kowalevskii]|uniref:Mediator of RNA polymerase II transcription subunit 4 n=1 Tax=Saccoglossus kowalevskii TaxID=10224 RepID=A0ABM0GZ82_SACKO|nr:PREDICTED: mediator of RNA polymerase II transcription subunit 4-like [Saccoglossus kowalevskii]
MATYISTKAKLLSLVEEAESLTKELSESTGGRTQRPTNPEEPQLIDALVKKDEEIRATLKQAEAQGERQKEMEQLQEQVDKRDQDIKQLQKQLKEAEHTLATAIYQAKEKLKAIEQASTHSIPVDDLIKYAHHISATNSVTAPMSWAPGDPRRPYPTDMEMRMGILGKMSNLPTVTNGHQNGTTEGATPLGMLNTASTHPSGLTWQPSTDMSSSTLTHNNESITNMDLSMGPNKDNEDDVEIMSTESSSSSSSDSQ